MTTKAARLDKGQALGHWQALEADQPLRMTPIPYKQEGSKYGCDGIRIDGTRQFIDSVLSHLKPLLAGENGETRLELNYTETMDRQTAEPTGQWVCYVRTHVRGGESQMMHAFLESATGRNPGAYGHAVDNLMRQAGF